MDERGRFLVELCRWRVLAGVGQEPSADTAIAPQGRVVVATSSPEPSQEPLIHIDIEVSAIRRYWRVTLVPSGKGSGLDALAHSLNYGDILHVVGHSSSVAEYSTEEGPQRALRFGEQEALDAAHAKFPSTAPQMAVLSSCSTAASLGGLWGDDNLASALLLQGVPIVVASLWDVDSAASASLMGFFYEGLRHGSPPSEALQQAQ
jgi:CHAT domain-containing protein